MLLDHFQGHLVLYVLGKDNKKFKDKREKSVQNGGIRKGLSEEVNLNLNFEIFLRTRIVFKKQYRK